MVILNKIKKDGYTILNSINLKKGIERLLLNVCHSQGKFMMNNYR
jgi:hypothetical protein